MEELKEYNSVIQVCKYCGKVDVAKGHEKDCDPEFEAYRQQSMEYYD